jgi:hypothetical protein
MGNQQVSGMSSRPNSVDSPIRPNLVPALPGARQISFAIKEASQSYRDSHHEAAPYQYGHRKDTRHLREAYIDTNRHGHLTSPVKPSTGFYDRYDGQTQRPGTSLASDPAFHSIRRYLYESGDSVSAPIQRIPASFSSTVVTGQYFDMVTPTTEIPHPQDLTSHHLPPIIGHRTNVAPVSQWRFFVPFYSSET